MKKSIFNFALALLVLGTSVASTSAFMGGRQMMTPDRFAEFKAIVAQSDTAESFQESMKTIREAHQAEMQTIKDSVTQSIENIENGVIKTITSDNADMVAKLQSREDRSPKNEAVTHSVELIANGVKITITSDDSELVERIQENSDKGFGEGRGHKMGMKEGMAGRFGKAGVEKPENWTEMETEEKQAFMQENTMGRKQMKKGGEGRQDSAFRAKRRGGQGVNMNEQRKETLRERFGNWMSK